MAGRATLDFFAAQAAARRRTALLVALFALAWLGTIAVIHVALALVLGLAVDPSAPPDLLSPPLLLAAAGGVTAVTVLGAAWHGVRLAAGGGEAVARMLGGVPVDRGSDRPELARLVNVVEEMTIAAGVPMPGLFVLEEERGVNAFAAGFAPDRSIVAVTRGALEALSRDELQGVIAHELSHVVNADTRLNLQLVAAIGGLTALAQVGRIVLRGGSRTRLRGRRGSGGAVLAVGLVLFAAGSAGALFARLIRLAVSRQREYLADAAAVQFTRNPGGLAGALRKIAAQGSRLDAAHAPEAAHLMFANGLGSTLLSTHPPVEERIRRILGGAAGSPAAGARAARPAPAGGAGLAAGSALVSSAAAADAVFGDSPTATPRAAGPSRAAALLAALPAELARAAREPFGARALASALLADRDPLAREPQLGAPAADALVRAEARRLAGAVQPLDRASRFALLELLLPSLDALSPEQARGLVRDLAALAAADGRTTVYEWSVLHLVRRRVAPALAATRTRAARARRVEEVLLECHEVLSTLAWLAGRDPSDAQAALDAGAVALGPPSTPWRVLPRDRASAARLDAALDRLDAATPAVKERLLAACAACVRADGRVQPAEAEVVRVIAASLGVPAPPLEPDPPLASRSVFTTSPRSGAA